MMRLRVIAAFLLLITTTGYGEIPEEKIHNINVEEAMRRLECRGEDEEERVEVGTLALSHEEEVEIEEERARLDLEEQHSTPEQVAATNRHLFKKSLALSAKVEEKSLTARDFYQTSHPGAFYHPVALSPLCDQVTLNDGSMWGVHYSDHYKIMGWMQTDCVVISPNDAWFSTYKFLMTNKVTGDAVEVNMVQGPYYNGLASHWVVAVDYYNQQMMLEDGTLWNISYSDYSVMKYWQVNDTVMIGINTSWFSSYPNILINVKRLNYVRGICQLSL